MVIAGSCLISILTSCEMDSHQYAKPSLMSFRLRWLFISAALIAGFRVFADYYAVSEGGTAKILIFADMLALPICAAVPGVFVAAAFLYSKRTRQVGLKWMSTCVIFVLLILGSIWIGHYIRMSAFVALAERSAPLVAAIKAYETKFGRPPDSLQALVPDFLPAIPGTGMGAYPRYHYRMAKGISIDNNAWRLSVFTPTGVLNFDEFFYYPLQNYPDHVDGNGIERIRDWAYLHE